MTEAELIRDLEKFCAYLTANGGDPTVRTLRDAEPQRRFCVLNSGSKTEVLNAFALAVLGDQGFTVTKKKETP